ncbi:hypothetical protein [Scytonema sp. NUACC21]
MGTILIDRQEFRTSVNRILDYLRDSFAPARRADRNGGSPPPQQ